jgi:hypothetical protein
MATTAQKLANPGLRSKIKDAQLKKLSPKLYAQRVSIRRQKQRDALLDPTQILSGANLRQYVNSEVDAETRPQLDEIDKQIGQTTTGAQQYTADSNASSDRVMASLAAQLAGQNQSNAAAAARQDQINAQAQTAITDAGEAATRNLQGADPKLVSGPLAQLAEQTAAAHTASATTGAAAATRSANASNAYSGLISTMQGAAAMQKGEAARSIADKATNTLTGLRQDRQNVVAKRGTLRTKYTQDAMQQGFVNYATAKGLQLDMSQFAESVRSHKAGEAIDRDQLSAQTQAAQAKIDADQGKADAAAAAGAAKINEHGYRADDWADLTVAQRRQIIEQDKKTGKGAATGPKPAAPDKVESVNTEIQNALKVAAKAAKGGKVSRQAIGDALMKGQKASKDNGNTAIAKVSRQLYAGIALDVAYDGHVSRTNAARLHKLGIKVSDLGLPSYAQWKAQQGRTTRARRNPLVGTVTTPRTPGVLR